MASAATVAVDGNGVLRFAAGVGEANRGEIIHRTVTESLGEDTDSNPIPGETYEAYEVRAAATAGPGCESTDLIGEHDDEFAYRSIACRSDAVNRVEVTLKESAR